MLDEAGMRIGWLFGVCVALVSLGAAAKECSVVPVSFEFNAEWECFVDDPEPSDIFARDGRIFLKKDGEEIPLTAGPRDRRRWSDSIAPGWRPAVGTMARLESGPIIRAITVPSCSIPTATISKPCSMAGTSGARTPLLSVPASE
jgi:hypothetical protein